MFRSIAQALASLKFTVVLLAVTMVVVFLGTLAQNRGDIWDVQAKYFYSFGFVTPLMPGFGTENDAIGWLNRHVLIPLPGGYTLAAALLVNLAFYTVMGFRLTVRKIGAGVLHVGIAVLLIGQVITSQFAVEQHMSLLEGRSASWTINARESELVLIDPTRDTDNEFAISTSHLAAGRQFTHPQWPVRIRVVEYLPDAAFAPLRSDKATHGIGLEMVALPRQDDQRTSDDESWPAAHVTVYEGDRELGTWLASSAKIGVIGMDAAGRGVPGLVPEDRAQEVKLSDGRVLLLQMRKYRRYYKPYTVTLLSSEREDHPRSDIPKSYTSTIHFASADGRIGRDVAITMNHPFRYAGDTFYQQNVDGRRSTFQVVFNPGWTVPYIGCVIVAIGMFYHFVWGLVRFTASRESHQRRPGEALGVTGLPKPFGELLLARVAGWVVPAVFCLLGLVLLASSWLPRSDLREPYDLATFGRLPVLHDGRVKPVDTAARAQLMRLMNRQSVTYEGRRLSAVEWYLTAMTDQQTATKIPVIRVDDPQVKVLFGVTDDRKKLFSYNDVRGAIEAPMADGAHPGSHGPSALGAEFARIQRLPRATWTQTDRHLMETKDKIDLLRSILFYGGAYHAPPLPPDRIEQAALTDSRAARTYREWLALPEAIDEADATGIPRPAMLAWQGILAARQNENAALFNEVVASYAQSLDAGESALPPLGPVTMKKMAVEAKFNRGDPYFYTMWLYVGVFLLASLSLAFGRRALGRSALWLGVIAFIYHAGALGASIYIHGKPPVTNLYASAVFVGFGAVGLGLLIELIYRRGLGSMVMGIAGFGTLMIARYLDAGDNFRPVVAVLDTSLWLIVHVLTITIGYSAAFIAGLMAIVYIVLGLFTPLLRNGTERDLGRMIYGTVCFAMFFSFIGTVTGGIWADQSWGRFWGWDPKENGALLLVLITAVMLHARWCGWIGNRGMAVLAVVGNIVTAWAWFGTNMLGVGLHSYGFMERGAIALGAFVVSQVVVIGMGLFPRDLWLSKEPGEGEDRPDDSMPAFKAIETT